MEAGSPDPGLSMEPLIQGAPAHDPFQSVFMIPKHAASLETASRDHASAPRYVNAKGASI